MKALISAILATALTLAPAGRQETVTVPPCKPDLKLVIDILVDFDVKHVDSLIVEDGHVFWAMTEFDGKLIRLYDGLSMRYRRQVVIHEAIHVCYRNKGIDMPYLIEEQIVTAQEADYYREIFGQ